MLVFTLRVEEFCLIAPDEVMMAVVPEPDPLVIRLEPVMFEKPEILEKLPDMLPDWLIVNPVSVLEGPATNPGAVKELLAVKEL